MKPYYIAIITIAATVFGCSQPAEQAPAEEEATPAASTETAAEEMDGPAPMRDFAPLTIGPYEVQPKFEEEIEDGHYNIQVEGGDFAAVRLWVGTEDNSDVMVVKTEVEYDYQHGHLEVPDPIPADYALWIEIEDTEGNTHLGSTPLIMHTP